MGRRYKRLDWQDSSQQETEQVRTGASFRRLRPSAMKMENDDDEMSTVRCGKEFVEQPGMKA